MSLLFSYGMLQQEDVQLATFGRRVVGVPDELPGFIMSSVKIADAKFVAETGMTHYSNVVFTGVLADRIQGMVLEVTDEELAASDEYEADADYFRREETLASGNRAWVYRCHRNP